MTIRTSSKTVTFMRPFVLDGLDEVQPAGTYDVETDEELLDTLSTPAYRRISTLLHLHARPSSPGVSRTVTIDPVELETVLAEDAMPPPVC
jgi:hypothetical protein